MTTILSRTVRLRACAKVNLCLAVQHPPVGGYHQLESVFQVIDLADELAFGTRTAAGADARGASATTRLGTPVVLDCRGLEPDAVPAPEENLVFRAVDAAERAFGQPMAFDGQVLRIEVDKRIPAGGGLGGGSSDAACALRAYARFQGLNPLDSKMLEVARGLGADVAFFLYGGAALMRGRGDELVRCLPNFPLPLVLMGDSRGCPTPLVYRRFDEAPQAAPDARALARAMEGLACDPAELAGLCANNLQDAAFAVAPGLEERLRWANASEHVLAALVTGSGSTSYAICPDEDAARAFAREAASRCAWVRVAHACEGQ